jgi:hypothetical protein
VGEVDLGQGCEGLAGEVGEEGLVEGQGELVLLGEVGFLQQLEGGRRKGN